MPSYNYPSTSSRMFMNASWNLASQRCVPSLHPATMSDIIYTPNLQPDMLEYHRRGTARRSVDRDEPFKSCDVKMRTYNEDLTLPFC